MSIAARLLRAAVWLPLLALIAYAVSFATQFPRLIGDFYWNSDIDSSMVLAENAVQHGHGGIHFANSAPYSTVFLDIATHPLPGHREVWIAWPLLAALLGIAVLGWTVHRMAGRWAALIAVCVATASTPLVLSVWITQGVHGRTLVAVVLLSALLLLLLDGTMARRPLLVGVLAALIGAVAGATAVSDPLFVVSGIAPAVLAAGFHLVRERGRGLVALASGGGVAAVAAITTAVATVFLAHRAQMVRSGFEVHAASITTAHQNFHILGADLADMAGATIHVAGRAPAVIADVFVALAAAAGIAVAVQVLWRKGVAALPGAQGPANAAMLVYWYLVGISTLAAFVVADVVLDEFSTRYLLPLLFATAVCTALLAQSPRRARIAVPAALLVSSLVAANTITLFTATTRSYDTPGLENVIAALDARGLHDGYGDYWVSNVVTWKTAGRVAIRSVQQGESCAVDAPATVLCPELFNSADDWYRPKPGPTFLLIDPASDVTQKPDAAVFGEPREVIHVGAFTVYVYDGDLRSHMASPVTSMATHAHHGRTAAARVSGRRALAASGHPAAPPCRAPGCPLRLASRL